MVRSRLLYSTYWLLYGPGIPGFDSRQRYEIYIFFNWPKSALWTYPVFLFKGYTMGSFPRIKQKGCEAHHSPLSSAEIKNEWSYTAAPLISLHGLHGDSPFCIECVIQLWKFWDVVLEKDGENQLDRSRGKWRSVIRVNEQRNIYMK